MSNFKIIGTSNPEVGKEIIYKTSISNLPGSLPGQINPVGNNPFAEQVKWSIYILEYGKWILKEKNNKTGPTAHYTFTAISLKRQGIRIVALLGNEKATLDIKPLDTIERKIVKVELCDALGNLQTKPFAYNQTVLARVHCLNLDNCAVHVTLWEDDAPGAGHNEINKNNKAITKSEMVSNGIADVKFRLAPDFAKMADAQLAKRDKSEGKTHEYYVTAEIFRQETKSSNNIDVTNPNNKTTDTKATPQKPVAQKPVTKLVAVRPIAPASKKGPSKKDEKGILETVTGTIYDWGESKFKAVASIFPDPMEIINSVAKLDMGDSWWKKKDEKGVCVCKENNFYWSDKLTCDERKKVLEVCAKIWGEDKKKDKASELMSVIHLETGNITPFKPYADNGKGFSGLIQFSDAAAKQLGTTRTNLKKMTFIDQMVYVENYLIKKKLQLNTMTDLYLMVLKPNAVGKGNDPDFILFDESISVPDGDGKNTSQKQREININQEPWVTKYGYSSNPSFMNGDEHKKRNKWVYTRQQYEQRWGFENGNTTVGEVTKELKEQHYNKGKTQIFTSKCENIEEEENESGKRAPWMDIAIDVAKDMKGCTEDKDPMYTNAKKYLKYCGNTYEPTDGINGPWCAAFMNWSIGQTKNIETNKPYLHAKSAASLAPIDRDLGVRYKKIETPIYGCIVVYKHITQWKGHTGFLFGKTKGGEYILIGGNQDDTIRFDSYGEYTSKSKKKKICGFYIPKDYVISSEDDITDKDIYVDAEVLNKKFGIVSKKAEGKTN